MDRQTAQSLEPGRWEPVGGALPARPLDNLPAALTTFVGRRTELDTLTYLARTQRLVTATGPGGVGKTRLALATRSHCRPASRTASSSSTSSPSPTRRWSSTRWPMPPVSRSDRG